MMVLSKTRVKLREQMENGSTDLDDIKNDNLIQLVIFFIDEYLSENSLYESIKILMNHRCENLYKIKCEIARGIINEYYDELDLIFDEIHEDFMRYTYN